VTENVNVSSMRLATVLQRAGHHRTPLFIARVDLDRLCVLCQTEQILMPESELDFAGGFGIVNVNTNKTRVVSSEMAFSKNCREDPNRVLLAKILWRMPNRLVETQ
jgi:hypothetical protein